MQPPRCDVGFVWEKGKEEKDQYETGGQRVPVSETGIS